VTTYGDIRQFAPRGSAIIIDGNRCQIAEKGEWTAARIELVHDYSGSTNLDAQIEIPNSGDHSRSPKKTKAKIAPSAEIQGAVSDLSNIKYPTNSLGQYSVSSGGLGSPKKKKKATTTNSGRFGVPDAAPVMSKYSALDPSSPIGSPSGGLPLPSLADRPSEAAASAADSAEAAAMLLELRQKEAVGYPQRTFENMHRRLADEVCRCR
jgi:hypothetical protein